MNPAAAFLPKFFVISSVILILTGVGQVLVRPRKPGETTAEKLVNRATLTAFVSLVIGVAGMFDWSNLTGSAPDPFSPTIFTSHTRVTMLDTATARLGYTFGPSLLYVDGGVASPGEHPLHRRHRRSGPEPAVVLGDGAEGQGTCRVVVGRHLPDPIDAPVACHFRPPRIGRTMEICVGCVPPVPRSC